MSYSCENVYSDPVIHHCIDDLLPLFVMKEDLEALFVLKEDLEAILN